MIVRGSKETMEQRAGTVEEQTGCTYCRRLYGGAAAGASGDSACLFSWACGSTHSLSSSSSSSSVMVQAQAGKNLRGKHKCKTWVSSSCLMEIMIPPSRRPKLGPEHCAVHVSI